VPPAPPVPPVPPDPPVDPPPPVASAPPVPPAPPPPAEFVVSEPVDVLVHGYAGQSLDLFQRFDDAREFEGLDDRFDLFHIRHPHR